MLKPLIIIEGGDLATLSSTYKTNNNMAVRKRYKKRQTFEEFQQGLYNYYMSLHKGSKISYIAFLSMITAYKERTDKYLVYVGYSKKDKEKSKVIYVGTTIQYPLSRWYYHKTHGKDLVFEEYKRFDNEKDMLDLEFELIKKFNPSCNSIRTRRQNFNIELTQEELDRRKGNPEWCQCCLRRRVNVGYKYCYYCLR